MIEAASGPRNVDTEAEKGPKNNKLKLLLISELKGHICLILQPRQTHLGRSCKRSRLVEEEAEKVVGGDGSSESEEDDGNLVQYVGTVLGVEHHFGHGYEDGISKTRIAC